jgi:M6 family metalloprotease-like protein
MLISKMSVSFYFFVLVMIFTGYIFPVKGYAVPAAPVIHPLTQPDGTIISAKQWGDESYHGWETEDGYTIIFDKGLESWVYAIQNTDGELVSSSRVVDRDDLPDNCVPHLRLAGKAQLRIIKKMTTRESRLKKAETLQNVVPTTGTANVPVIMINFNDTDTSFTVNNFNLLLFGTNTNSMRDYYEEVSYGEFSVSPGPTGVLGWYIASDEHEYYGKNDTNGYDKWPGDLVYEAVQAADDDVDFSIYDMDNDGYVDVVNIIHQGTGEEFSGDDTDIWSHRWDLNSAEYFGYSHYGEYRTNDRNKNGNYVRVNDYVIQPEQLDEGTQETVGVFAHEYGHSFGLPDLYDTDYSSNGIGDWSLMASGSWNYVSEIGDRPAHMDAWSKYFLGWVNPKKVKSTLTNEPITQAATTSDVYQLLSGNPLSGEYFLVENRQRANFDAGLPGDGLLIWHVDGNLISKKIDLNTVNNKECYPSKNCSKKHYGVALVQADDDWDLELDNNLGDAGDPYPGNTNNSSFNKETAPNSKLYNGKKSGVSITNISTSNATMTATLSVESK